MGLIRSGQTSLTSKDDKALTPYLWSITAEVIKTALENGQNLIVEGCYIPFTWQESFSETALQQIEYCCLVMSDDYLQHNKNRIIAHANDSEKRKCVTYDEDFFNELIQDNAYNLTQCKIHHLPYYLIDSNYNVGSLSFEVLIQNTKILWEVYPEDF